MTNQKPQPGAEQALGRRRFLAFAGLAASPFAFSSCTKNAKEMNSMKVPSEGGGKDGGKSVVNLGSGDIGILNYAYALEQLEAAFYIQAVKTPYANISEKELTYLTDIRDHEIAHREFFKTALGDERIGGIIVNFDSINFSSRESVLQTAKAFEDLGVSAYNGAGELLQNSTFLLLAGKIVSVEARHAAAIRDLLSYGSFADSTVVDAMGLDLARRPSEVLSIASSFISTRILAHELPTS